MLPTCKFVEIDRHLLGQEVPTRGAVALKVWVETISTQARQSDGTELAGPRKVFRPQPAIVGKTPHRKQHRTNTLCQRFHSHYFVNISMQTNNDMPDAPVPGPFQNRYRGVRVEYLGVVSV